MDLFKENRRSSEPAARPETEVDQTQLLRVILQKERPKAPSHLFSSIAVFDIVRMHRNLFAQHVQDEDLRSLFMDFVAAYRLFLNEPQTVGFTPAMIDYDREDTDLREWSTDIFQLDPGDYVALLYMPIKHDSLASRIVGIVFSDRGDGYYYCMLSKDQDQPSTVMRYKAMRGMERLGEVMGSGFDLMHGFLSCLKNDFYSG